MLTRDLLRYRVLSGYIRPMFVEGSEQRILTLAEDLLKIYRSGTGLPKTETDSAAQMLANRWTDLKLPRGFIKILDDSVLCTDNASAEFPEQRRKLFEESARLLAAGTAGEMEAFRSRVFAGAALPELPEIYADLPDFARIEKVPDWTPAEFIGRYNCALAQSLLIYASSLDLTIHDAEPAQLRRFFKYLKFFRLMVSAKAVSWGAELPTDLQLHIDGPASILEQGTAYGIRLASFFPAVLQLTHWKMSCALKMQSREYKFILDEKSMLSRRFGTYSAYVPEEIAMFESLFRKNSEVWKISEESPFLRLKGQHFIFPDFSFSNGSETVHLELLHRWHAGVLKDRLEFLKGNPGFPLILGVDRALFPKNGGGTAALEEDPLYGRKVFLFRDFPGVERVLRILSKIKDEIIQ